MLTVQMQSVNNASFGIYFPKFIGTTYELLSAPLSFVEIVIGYVGAVHQHNQLLFLQKIMEQIICLLYTSPSPRDRTRSRMPSSA